MNDCNTKPCTQCGQTKPLTTKYFYRDAKQSTGFRPRCKDCEAIIHGRKRQFVDDIGKRECKVCQKTFDETTEFFWKKGNGFTRTCIECSNKLANEKRRINGTPKREKRRTEEQRREQQRVLAKARYWKAVENGLEPSKRPHAIYESKRRAKARGLPYKWTPEDWKRCLDYWNNKCCICGGIAENGMIIAQEHWIAIKDERPNNPGTVPKNILPMCHNHNGKSSKPGCNNRKWKHDPIEWLFSIYSVDKASEILERIENYFASIEG